MADKTIKPKKDGQLNNKTNKLWPTQQYTKIIYNSTVKQKL